MSFSSSPRRARQRSRRLRAGSSWCPSCDASYCRDHYRKVEVYDDPRVTGVLPRAAAPQVPLIEAPGPHAGSAIPWDNPRP